MAALFFAARSLTGDRLTGHSLKLLPLEVFALIDQLFEFVFPPTLSHSEKKPVIKKKKKRKERSTPSTVSSGGAQQFHPKIAADFISPSKLKRPVPKIIKNLVRLS